MHKHAPVELTVLPEELKIIVPPNTSLHRALLSMGLPVNFPCGGAAICGKCKVRFEKGAPEPTLQEVALIPEEERKQGWRLACLAPLPHDAVVHIPDSMRLQSYVAGEKVLQRGVNVKPFVRKVHLNVPLDRLGKAVSEVALVSEELRAVLPDLSVEFSLDALRRLPRVLRAANGSVTLTLFRNQLIDLESGDTREDSYALAIDLGTTTVGLLLLHLPSGQTIDYAAFPNPQGRFGADLIARIAHAAQKENAVEEMRDVLMENLAEVVGHLCLVHQISPSHIYLIGFSGNTVMTQIFWGIDPRYVGQVPFKPTFHHLLAQTVEDLPRPLDKAKKVLSFPLIGGFVGGDTVADLLTAEFDRKKPSAKWLLLDIGTNCEVVLAYKGKLLAASAPAGPALEGAKISQGMRAIPGAISDVREKDGVPHWSTVEDAPAEGICGSGLFHVIAYLLEQKVILKDGRIDQPAGHPYWRDRIVSDDNGVPKILLLTPQEGAVREVFLTQLDIREFQLANAAIRSAWMVLTRQSGITAQSIHRIFIAGAFGNYIRSEALLSLGTIPRVPQQRIRFLGNASLEGVRQFVLDRGNEQRVEELARKAEFVELADSPEFQEIFVQQLNFEVFKENERE